jgi:large subunit ribosomal protein L21
MFAIVRTGGKQYRVQEGDRIAVERLDEPEGAELTLDDVLLVGDGDAVTVGTPVVEGATVTAKVAEHFRDKKVLSYTYKNKTRQRTLRGHRQQQTRLEILDIAGG